MSRYLRAGVRVLVTEDRRWVRFALGDDVLGDAAVDPLAPPLPEET